MRDKLLEIPHESHVLTCLNLGHQMEDVGIDFLEVDGDVFSPMQTSEEGSCHTSPEDQDIGDLSCESTSTVTQHGASPTLEEHSLVEWEVSLDKLLFDGLVHLVLDCFFLLDLLWCFL